MCFFCLGYFGPVLFQNEDTFQFLRPAMKLVEVIRVSETSDETIATLFEFSKRLGKVPVACKDTPGYVHLRLRSASTPT